MAENKNVDLEVIHKMIQGLSPEEQQALIESLAKKEERKKVRRKHYKPEQEVRQPKQETKRKRGEFHNKFEDSPLFEAHKQDAEVDKKLWKGREPLERDRPNNLVVARCTGCGKTEKIQRNLVFRSGSGADEQAQYYCNRCIISRG